MTAKPQADPGSFRDHRGRVFLSNGQILRTVQDSALEDVEKLQSTGLMEELIARGFLIGTRRVSCPENASPEIKSARLLLEHDCLPFISYPYEWSFEQLKDAAIFHLDLQLFILDRDFVLSDASAYNVQFTGSKPVFIDVLSLRRYREGEQWVGYAQFCEQFLHPLLLDAYCGVAHNEWLRGSLEGISAADINQLVPIRKRLSPKYFINVGLKAGMERWATRNPDRAISRAKDTRPLSRAGYQYLLRQLRKWIFELRSSKYSYSDWGDYETTNTYSQKEELSKREYVANCVEEQKPNTFLDFGCNAGDYCTLALNSGAESAIGLDFDKVAIAKAYKRAKDQDKNFLPLFMNAFNPSPDQGWLQVERRGLAFRCEADFLIALAFEHHLVIGKNAPMDQVISWIVSFAPSGIIEFVPKDDPTVQQMLALREDVFPSYDEATFVNAIKSVATIVDTKIVSSTGRKLFLYKRKG